MAKYLIIVESPTKVKTISRFLGKNYKVEASVGHVRDLPKSQLGVDTENNFEPKYITIRGKGDVIAKLKKEAKAAEKIFLATDPDREGEAISWHLSKILGIDESSKCRITFNEITKTAVTEALKSARSIDMDLVDAQQARRVLDRIVGYKISPILWKKIRKGLSAGRVQSVATRMICDREKEIQDFKSEEYWTLTAMLAGKTAKSLFEAKFFGIGKKKLELKCEDDVKKVMSGLEGVQYTAQSVKHGTKKRMPAPPFTTSLMQQEASRKLNFATRKTMLIAQQLYEGVDIKGHGSTGLVTYIRTDSVRIADEAAKEARDFLIGEYGQNYVPENIPVYKTKASSQDAHEAIRPAHMELSPNKIKDSLSNDQYKLYKLIWDRFLASQMAGAIYDTMTVEISAGQYTFKANGSRIKFNGFLALYEESKDDDTSEENVKLPQIDEGDILPLKNLESKQNFTQPPFRYTEASLIKAMEENGIGRPSTYAPTIATILARYYIEKEKKALKPTELGNVVNDIMSKHFKDIVNIRFTAEMENSLDSIADGKIGWRDVMQQFYTPFADTLKKAEDEIGDIEIKDEETDIICEKCGRKMVIKNGRNGKFIACPGFPQCRNSKPIIHETGEVCPKCGGRVIYRTTKKNKKYICCENVPICDFMLWDMPTGEKCPKCGSFTVSKISFGKKQSVRCSNPECDYLELTEKSKKSDEK